MVESARYTSGDNSTVAAVIDGREWQTKLDSGNDISFAVLAWIAEGNSPSPYVPPAPSLEDYSEAVQDHIDATARAKNYTDVVSLVSYATSTNPQWAAEANAFLAWRDQVWASIYTTLAQVQAGQLEQPTIEELIATLPVINWPS